MDQPGHAPDGAVIDEALIHALVHRFYARVRQDALIGPVFNATIGEDWDAHLAKLCDFWSGVMLSSGRYRGNPMRAHAEVAAIRPEHFTRWLDLFGQTAREVCPPEAAAAFIARAQTIARSLQLGLFFRA
jgi:hemoglobin